MKKTIGRFLQATSAVTLFTLITHTQPAFAGWTGLINGTGTGWASVNVRSATLQTNRLTTVNNLLSPSAAMSPTTGYKTNAPLPSGASTNTYSRIRGLPGGIWQAATKAAIGDGADNLELQNRITIVPADCASLTFDSVINQTQGEFNANGNSGTITVNASATAGTALWLRGFEYSGSMDDVPTDNPDTIQNESIEYLKIYGVAKFETLVLGPFEFGGITNCPLIVPFTLSNSNLESLVFVADGVALSLPMVIICPSNIVVNCEQPVTYPPVQVAGCGDITVSYNPPAPISGSFPAGYFPVGVTPVTVTATDSAGDSTNCVFTVTVTDTVPPEVPELPTLTGQCSLTVPEPAPVTDNCGGLVTGTTSDPLTYTSQGTFTVRWAFSDGNGNTTTANQTVIVKDTIPPVAPVLPTITGNCGTPVTLTAPTTMDNCAGTVTGTTTNSLVCTTAGTNIIYWTFNDGNGNATFASQKVIVPGITFKGFYSPIGGTGGTCAAPLIIKCVNSTLPIKFDLKCGTQAITRGVAPLVRIQKYSSNCTPGDEIVVVNAVYQNDWHYNWNVSNRIGGTYKITIVLPDGTSQFVFVKLK